MRNLNVMDILILVLSIYMLGTPNSIIVITSASQIITEFCLNMDHVCALFESKKVKCWGNAAAFGVSDIIGDEPNEIGINLPYVDFASTSSVSRLACGGYKTCVILESQDLKCLGFNQFGDVGLGLTGNQAYIIGKSNGYIGDALPKVNLGNNIKALDFALGLFHACIKVTGNKVKCFGMNDYGQLGYGDKNNTGSSPAHMGDNLPFVDLGTNVQVSTIISKAYHNCAILSAPVEATQRVKCWGSNNRYQLGYGDANNRGDNAGEMGDKLPLVDFGTESKVKSLALGGSHTCVLLVNDVFKCFGFALLGQIASGFTYDIATTGNDMPSTLIDSGKKVLSMSAGAYSTCILYTDGLTAKCFGYNNGGQLGQGDTVGRGNSPSTMIPSIPAIDFGTGTLKMTSIHATDASNCVVFADSSVKCFGDNGRGQFAVGTTVGAGAQPTDMGTNLKFAVLFSPTTAPTKSPTVKPTSTPTRNPTQKPTANPNMKPTKKPKKTDRPTLNPSLAPDGKCNYATESLCKENDGCKWVRSREGDESCLVFSCSDIGSKGKCRKDNRCKWNKGVCEDA